MISILWRFRARARNPSTKRPNRYSTTAAAAASTSRALTAPGTPPAQLTWWQRIRKAEISNANSLWARGVGALLKIREWSEIVAGPRWKTFIRRFHRNRSSNRHANFQYDALSYAMNFDEGPGHNGNFDEEGEDGYFYGPRNFSSRYAKGSMDLSKDGPTFV